MTDEPAPEADENTSFLRSDPFKDSVIVAPQRAKRPHATGETPVTPKRPAATKGGSEGGPSSGEDFDPDCPFCPGNESQTPPEIVAIRPPESPADSAGWSVRVIPNLYPAVSARPEANTPRAASANMADWPGDALHAQKPALGNHEVAIHSPHHHSRLAELPSSQLELAMQTWKLRCQAHRSEGLAITIPIVNEGRAAGASLAHPHAQLFGLEFVPQVITHELAVQAKWQVHNDESLLGQTVAAQVDGPRFVDKEGSLVAWAPWWSSTPYEVWLSSSEPDSSTGAFADSSSIQDAALLLGRVCLRIKEAAGDPALNVVLRDIPHAMSAAGGSDPSQLSTWWHIRVLPRIGIEAGFEAATGIRILTLSPESAAEALRFV